MERLLHKIARQLDSLDEASLMALWSKYAIITSRFEPTDRWEEACLIFSLIQAKRWKNQLFNYYWSKQKNPPDKNAPKKDELKMNYDFSMDLAAEENDAPKEECQILQFKPLVRHSKK